MRDVKERLGEIVQRAGLGNVPPRAIAAGAAVCAVGVAVAIWRWIPADSSSPALRVESATQTPPAAARGASASGEPGVARSAAETTGAVFVHVVGAVPRPGLYRLSAGARVAEALAAAGGLLGSAEERAVNLARPVSDGEQIVVPTKDEFARAAASGGAVSAASGGAGGPAAAAGPVDINSADAAALDTLPGVGPSTAAKIVADREANGPFSSPEDLGRVSGIGPKKLETLLGLIVAR